MRAKERASQEILRQAENPKKLLGHAVNIAGFAGGSALATKIVPFLSQFIPEGLAVKGLSKLDPRIGKFFKGLGLSGIAAEEGIDFLRSQTEKAQEPVKSSVRDYEDVFKEALTKNGLQQNQQGQYVPTQQGQEQPQQQGGGINPQLLEIMQQVKNSMKKLGA